MTDKFEMVAKTFQGLEDVLAEELRDLGAENVEPGRRMVSFEGDLEMLYKANLCCRTALRILKPIFKFTAVNTDELYDRAKEFDWGTLMSVGSTFSIDTVAFSDEFTHSRFVTYRVKDAIVDWFKDRYGDDKRPGVRLQDADVMINVHISGDQVTLSLDSSGESLHKRGYRVAQTEAPINEVLAAGIILKSGWRGDCPLVDPMCGSGTFLIEAALIAANINPGVYRRHFSFENWKDFDPELFDRLYNDDSEEREVTHKIIGADMSPRAIDIAAQNIRSAGVGRMIELHTRPLSEWQEAPEGGILDPTSVSIKDTVKNALKYAEKETDRETYQAMEALIHNLNTMNSRAGAQVPFSSINYGLDTSPEGRMVIKNVLLAEEAGLGMGETPIFPIHIFKVKEGINYNKEDPNYDLFKLACRVSAKRLFPNFSFIDAPFNLQYYVPGDYNTEIAYMGCRTRVIGNIHDPNREIVTGRGNLSFTSINLPRLAINANHDIDKFFDSLDEMLNLVVDQLLDRLRIQSEKTVRNYPFLMGQGVWIDSDKLKPDDKIGEILKHGTLSIGFIGLAECLKALVGKHHGEDEEARKLGYKIIQFMRDRMDEESEKHKLNFSLLATPAEGLSGRFVKIDKKLFGEIEGITDRDYYTNSFHVPVYYNIGAFDKIKIEAPFHAMTNAGHISYIELDGDPCNNIDAFEKIVRCMKESGIGYGSINHPVDRDPVCGYTGIIGDECPQCHRHDMDDGIKFERIRRITGYLVGTLDRFNDAKLAEVKDRVKHNTTNNQ